MNIKLINLLKDSNLTVCEECVARNVFINRLRDLIETDVSQGCIMSSWLFNVFIGDVLREVM